MKINSNDFKDITGFLRDISKKASNKILDIYNHSFDVKKKLDDSPITKADLESNDIICKSLGKEFPNIPVISEENRIRDYKESVFFLVDPLDGTKEFINKNGEFTVNIGLVIDNISRLGVIEIPITGVQYFSDGESSFKFEKKNLKKISSLNKRKKIKIVVSRSHLDSFTINLLNKIKYEHSTLKVGSSIKFCLVAEGEADLYLRKGNTMEWDTAAGSAIIKTSHSKIYDFNLKELKYGKKDFRNSSFIVCNENINEDFLKLITNG
jgi:3'(2'), 5'-bisphosphate nucleotidase